MSEALRHKVERFDRFQRQFARSRHRHQRDEFERALDALVARAQQSVPPPLSILSAPRDLSPGQEEYDQEMRDLLVRVASREPVRSPITRPLQRAGSWWSPTPVYGFRMWQVIAGALHGAKMPWAEPELTAVCLHRSTDPEARLPHDAAECRRPPCGIYATKTPDMIRRDSEFWFSGVPITIGVGVVALTGRVIEHELGYRAEQARVAAMAVLAGAGSTCAFTWVDDPGDLALLFADPGRFLETAPGRMTSADEALDTAFDRVKRTALLLTTG